LNGNLKRVPHRRLFLTCAIGLILAAFLDHATPIALGQEDTVENAFALLQQAGQVDAVEARRLLAEVVKVLGAEKSALPAAEKQRLASGFRDRLADVVSTPQQLDAIMGPSNRPTVARQVWYRHYREQRAYNRPLRLIVVVDQRKGHEPSIQSVRLPAEGPP